VLLGLGATPSPPALRVHWAGGAARELRAAPLDRYLVVPAP
jgi:hypothetical protein